jgi:hypothetical protein
MVHYVRLKSILRQDMSDCDSPAQPTGESGAIHFGVGQMSETQWIGCHARELHRGESFRWTEPVATFHLAVQPGSYEVVIETRALRGSPSDYLLACYWNQHSVPQQVMTATDGVLRCPIGRDHFVAGRTQQLSLICRALLPRSQGVADDRRLGMPVFAIRLNACDATRDGTATQRTSDDAQAA